MHEVSILADEDIILKLWGQMTIKLEVKSLTKSEITAVNSGGCHGVYKMLLYFSSKSNEDSYSLNNYLEVIISSIKSRLKNDVKEFSILKIDNLECLTSKNFDQKVRFLPEDKHVPS